MTGTKVTPRRVYTRVYYPSEKLGSLKATEGLKLSQFHKKQKKLYEKAHYYIHGSKGNVRSRLYNVSLAVLLSRALLRSLIKSRRGRDGGGE